MVRDRWQAGTLERIAAFYNGCRYGYEGWQGWRKSTDLRRLAACFESCTELGLLSRDRTVLLDLGCADGRVNVLASYFVRLSLGIEIDAEILAEAEPRRKELEALLQSQGLTPPPSNLHLFHGDSLEAETYQRIRSETGVCFEDVNLFYTYITLHDRFAEKIAAEASPGALYLVYGFSKVLPRYENLELLLPDLACQGIAALYRKR
jgi:SAM-dependent methyltransferase